MMWQVPRMWEGGDVFILGGGPSLLKQFDIPDEVIKDVFDGKLPISAYSPYMVQLHDKHVIAINAAYLIGDWIDMVFFGDSGFFQAHKVRLAKFPGLKVSCHAHADKIDWVKYTPRDGTHARGISFNRQMVSWNGNSGCAAISIAAHTGAKRIILLGFDMRLDGNSRQHWHSVYRSNGIRTINPRKPSLPFDRHMGGMNNILSDAKVKGIEIINCSQESAITQFPKMTLEEILNK